MNHQILCQISQLNAQFIENYVRNDVSAHDKLLHENFSYLNASGARVGREEYLKAWATGFDPSTMLYWDMRDEKIELYGDIAFVSAIDRFEELVMGKKLIGMAAYTDTYIFEHGIWSCVRAQITMVSPHHWPSDDTILRVYIAGELQQGHRLGVN